MLSPRACNGAGPAFFLLQKGGEAHGKRNDPHTKPLPTWDSRMPPPPLLTSVAGGLLASSCCLIQLALNAAGVACAGFAALDPLRPAAVAATALLLAASHARHRTWRRTAVAVMVATVLAFSPQWTEAVGRAGGAAAWAATAVRRTPPPPPVTALDFRLGGVKCAACGERARAAAAAAHAGVARAAVAWREGRVRVDVAAPDADAVVTAVTAAVERAGFTVQAVEPAGRSLGEM